MTNFFTEKITLYNDVPADTINPRRFVRHVIDRCNIQNGYVEKSNGTISNQVNATTIITKAVERYKEPKAYMALPADKKADYFTVQTDDFIVFGEAADVVTTAAEWQALKSKYKHNGISVTSVNAYIYGRETDNISIVHA